MPDLSVLMPVRNGEKYLRRAMESVLGQTFGDFDFVIVDDGSTDGTTEIVRSYRDPRIRLEALARSRGLSAALNVGLACARTALVARQDADDISRADRLARQVALMQEQPSLALLGSQARLLDDAGRAGGMVRRPIDDVSIRWYALLDNPFIHTSVIFRREIVLRCGGFDPDFDPFSQDYDLWWRVMRHGGVRNLPEPLVDYRVNPSSIFGQHNDADAGAYWQRFEAMVRRAVASHLLETYSARGLQTDDATLLAGFVPGIDAAVLPAFLDRFQRLIEWFETDHPGARRSNDFAATIARQYDAIAYRTRAATRRDVVAVYRSALGRRPTLVSKLSWPRLFAMLAFGKAGRATAARWWGTLRWS